MMRAAGSAARRAAHSVSDGRSRAPWCGARGRCSPGRASVGLAGHRPYGHEGCHEHDPRDHHGRFQEAGALAVAEPADADPAENQRDENEEGTGVRDDPPDAEPRGLVHSLREVFPGALRVQPLRADAHHDVPGQRDEQQRPVPEPEEAGVAARKRERARAGQQSADEHHRPEDVDEQREVPTVGPRCGEERAHAPGFQIMSMRINTTTTVAAVCSASPCCVRLIATSSSLGPVWPAASSSFALFIPAVYAAPVRCPIPPDTAQRINATMIHGSQMSYPPYENASQIPKMSVPPAPMATAPFPTFAIGSMRIVSPGVSARR